MSEALKNKPRPGPMSLLDATSYRLPLAAKVSILHRASGMLMCLLLPFVLFLLDKSLATQEQFASFHAVFAYPLTKILILTLVWAYLHHFCAGVRHLIMDFHIGLDKESGKKSAAVVFAISLVLTALIGLKLFGVF